MHLSEHTWHWDACAPEAVLRAAGGRFKDLGGRAFTYGGDDLQNRRGILACNSEAALDAVLPVVSEIAKEKGLLADPPPREDLPTQERPLDDTTELPAQEGPDPDATGPLRALKITRDEEE